MVCRISSLPRSVSSSVRSEAAAAEGNRTEADGAYKVAVKKVDQAVAKGVLHKNTAAHRKSAMTLKLNKIG